MKAIDLKKWLEDIPDNTPVNIVEGPTIKEVEGLAIVSDFNDDKSIIEVMIIIN